MVDKVVATPAALELVELLKKKHGTLMFHQSGGCCDNSAANCYLPGEITMGAGDVLLGKIGDCEFYIGRNQYQYWKHTQLIIDVIEGTGGLRKVRQPDPRRRLGLKQSLDGLAQDIFWQQMLFAINGVA